MWPPSGRNRCNDSFPSFELNVDSKELRLFENNATDRAARTVNFSEILEWKRHVDGNDNHTIDLLVKDFERPIVELKFGDRYTSERLATEWFARISLVKKHMQ